DGFGGLDADGGSDCGEVVGAGDLFELVHGGETRLRRHHTGGGRNPKCPDEIPEAGIVVDHQDARLALADDGEGVRHATRHGDPVAGPDDQFVVATANDHLSLEDVPGVVKV